MKRIIFALLGLSLLLFPHHIFADEGWDIEHFHSNIAIQSSGKVRIIETISVDFHNTPKHGIYRKIPYEYEKDGKQTYTDIAIAGVLQNNQPATYKITQVNGYKELKIGDASKTITGRNVYTITYTATGILRGFSDHNELYWNVTGNDWGVPIQKADATVTLSTDALQSVSCYEGLTGSPTPCIAHLMSPKLAEFRATSELQSSEGLTIVAGYRKHIIPLLTVTPPKTTWEKLIELPSLVAIIICSVLGFIIIAGYWYRNGRDFWFGGALFGSRKEKGSRKPVIAHETTTVVFTPPDNLRPAEMGVLKDEQADTTDVVSTIIDLATRGYLTITEVPKNWLFGKVDYLLAKTTPPIKRNALLLLPYEQLLLDTLFDKRQQIKVSSLKTTFYDELKEVKETLYQDMISKGIFPDNPEKVRQKYLVIGFILLGVGGFLLVKALNTGYIFPADLCVGISVSGLAMLGFSRFMPFKTAYGHALYRQSKGYHLFVSKAETYRQRFFEKKNMFNEVLPYAIMFGLTEKFAKAMKDMGIKSSNPGWYSGSHPITSAYFASSLSGFSNSLSSAMASTPSSSGGFSGGSSGSGFGGGGGGSW